MSSPERIVIVGGGVAAHRCAFALRRLGYDRSVEVVSAEAEPPYDRTVLSKALLAAEDREPCIPLSPPSAYDEAGIDLRLGVHAARLDLAGSHIQLSSGEALAYDRLVLATGGRAVIPPPLDCDGVLTLRDAADLPRVHDALARV